MIVDRVPISALRKGSVVYVRVLKCASTFFYENLKTLGWNLTDYYEIDWRNDFVFAHIIHPILRRHKGIAEYLQMCGMCEQYQISTELQKLLSSCLVLDRHSLPYSAAFTDRLYDIFWIPLSDDYKQNVITTQDIINAKCQTNICLSDWNFDHAHVTVDNSGKKQVELLLQKIWESSQYDYEKILDHFWSELYHAVRDPAWPDAPTALDFYKLPPHIQHELATFHGGDAIKFISRAASWQLQLDPTVIPTNLITSAHYSALQNDIDLYNHVVKTFSMPDSVHYACR